MAAVLRGHPIWTPPPTIRIKKKGKEKESYSVFSLLGLIPEQDSGKFRFQNAELLLPFIERTNNTYRQQYNKKKKKKKSKVEEP
jgi:hypothetical protein